MQKMKQEQITPISGRSLMEKSKFWDDCKKTTFPKSEWEPFVEAVKKQDAEVKETLNLSGVIFVDVEYDSNHKFHDRGSVDRSSR